MRNARVPHDEVVCARVLLLDAALEMVPCGAGLVIPGVGRAGVEELDKLGNCQYGGEVCDD